jgi:hypothetical protein
MPQLPPINTTYTLTKNVDLVIRDIDQAYIPNDPHNRDWIEYQRWLAVPNTPNPAPASSVVFTRPK